MTDHLRAWLNERERIYNSNPGEITEFEWMDDRGYAYPKLLAGVRKVLEMHGPVDDEFESDPVCGWCRPKVIYPCSTVKKLQEAINDDE